MICNYYVDEAGDPTLFDKKGRVLIGNEGVSRFFILGLLRVDDPVSLEQELNDLRSNLLGDPYFAGIPSLRPENRKTAIAFHAKDDLAEVRREVFGILRKREDLRFFAIIRDKVALLSYVRQRNRSDPEYRYHPNEVYDYLARRLFRDRLHTRDGYNIYFAKRGSADRTEALNIALQTARERFFERYNKPRKELPISVIPAYSRDYPCLQAADYFLWGLQRLFERGEDRFVTLLWPSIRLIVDMDDTRFAQYGAYYDHRNPLTKEVLLERNKR